MKKESPKNVQKVEEIIIYEDEKGETKLEINLKDETIWLSLAQIAKLFEVDKSGASRHIRNIFKDGELDEKATIAKIATVQKEGTRKVEREIEYYNLDLILSVGYRVNSKRATQFRIWATQTLRQYLLDGFVVNEKRLKEKRDHKLKELKDAIVLMQNTMAHNQLGQSETEGLLHVITGYANSWLLLQQYDEGKLSIKKQKNRKIKNINYADAVNAISELKKNLMKKKEATDFFGRERQHGLESIVGNVNQSFGGKELYPSIEEKAAHFLYFVIKDHPFVDGNKRSGAFLFILFLQRNNCLINKDGERKISDSALVALALLVAESNPKEKEIMIALITNLLG